MKEYIFSYGTLQLENVQMELFGRTLQGNSDILRGYKTSTIDIKDESFDSKCEQKTYLIAVSSNNKQDNIKGTVFEITEKELVIADDYESDDYKRVRVLLESGKEAWVYAAV